MEASPLEFVSHHVPNILQDRFAGMYLTQSKRRVVHQTLITTFRVVICSSVLPKEKEKYHSVQETNTAPQINQNPQPSEALDVEQDRVANKGDEGNDNRLPWSAVK